MKRDDNQIMMFLIAVALAFIVIIAVAAYFQIENTASKIDSALERLEIQLTAIHDQSLEMKHELRNLTSEVRQAWAGYLLLKYGNETLTSIFDPYQLPEVP